MISHIRQNLMDYNEESAETPTANKRRLEMRRICELVSKNWRQK